jgi:hypothetical protein
VAIVHHDSSTEREAAVVSLSRAYSRQRAYRLGAVVVGSTLTLSASFFGIVALATGAADGALGRMPYYILATAAAFVGAMVLLEEWRLDAETVMRFSAGAGGAAFMLVGLSVEGVVFVMRYPESVVSSQLFVYVLSAGMMATGLGFWTARHYRELQGGPSGGL